MNGIFVRPETLEEALMNEGLYSGILQGLVDSFSEDRNQFVFDEIMESNKSEEEKLNILSKKEFIFKKDYSLLKRRISYEETIPRKILVSYPKRFLDKHFGPIIDKHFGPLTLQQAVYAFCNDRNVLREYEREKVVGSYCTEHELLELVKNKMNPYEYLLVLKNIGRKNGKNIN